MTLQNYLFVLSTLFLLTVSFAQTDTVIVRKSQINSFGTELGSQYLYYTLYYEHEVQIDKNRFGFGIDGSYFPTSYPANWETGAGLRFNYLYGEKSALLTSYTLGAIMNYNSIQLMFEDYSPQDRPRKWALYNGLGIGYQFNFKFGFSTYIKTIFVVETYNLLYTDETLRTVNKYRVWAAFGLKYSIKKDKEGGIK